MPEELWTEIPNIVQEAVIKAIPKKKKCRKAKWLSEEALQTAEKRREEKGKGDSILHRARTNNFTICMEIQKTSNSQSYLEKEEWNWRNQPT